MNTQNISEKRQLTNCIKLQEQYIIDLQSTRRNNEPYWYYLGDRITEWTLHNERIELSILKFKREKLNNNKNKQK